MTTDLKIIRDQNIFNLGDNIIRMNFILCHISGTNPIVSNLAHVFIGQFREELTRQKWLFYRILTFLTLSPQVNIMPPKGLFVKSGRNLLTYLLSIFRTASYDLLTKILQIIY